MRYTPFLVIAVLLMAAGALVACQPADQDDLSGAAVEQGDQVIIDPIQPPPPDDPGKPGEDPKPIVDPKAKDDPGAAKDDPGGVKDPGSGADEPGEPGVPPIPGFEETYMELQRLAMEMDQQMADRIGTILQPHRGEVLDYLGARGIIEVDCPECLPTYEAVYMATKLLVQDPDLTPVLIKDARERGTAEAFAADKPVGVPDLIDWIENMKDFVDDLEIPQ